MAEKDKRSRALLRNLRKQARKGTLSARERKTLLDQESKFRKARRGTAKAAGLGLAAGAAGLLASPAAQKALGAAADRFKSSKADKKASKAEEEKAKAFNELQESATPTADVDQAVAERVMGMRGVPSDVQEERDFTEKEKRQNERFEKRLDKGEAEFDKNLREESMALTPASDVDFSDIPSERKLQRNLRKEESERERSPYMTAMPRSSIMDMDRQMLEGRSPIPSIFDLRGRINQLDQLPPMEEFEPAGEEDIPNEFFPLNQIYDSRARSAYEPEVAPERKGPMAMGGRVSQADKLRKMIAKKYGIR